MFQQAVARAYPGVRLADAMAAVERQQQEFQQLQAWLQRQQADRQVPYVVTYPHLVVTESWLMGSAKVTSLQAGTRVVVCELAHQDNGKRVRGRICDPAGWITLLDQRLRMRGAMVQLPAPCQPVSPGGLSPASPPPPCGLSQCRGQPEPGPHVSPGGLSPASPPPPYGLSQCRGQSEPGPHGSPGGLSPASPPPPCGLSQCRGQPEPGPHGWKVELMPTVPTHSTQTAAPPSSGVVISTLERKWMLCTWLGSQWWHCLDQERSSFWRGRPPQDWTVRWGDQKRGYVWFNSDTQELFCEGALGLEASAPASGVVISSLERRWKLYQCLGREFWYCLDQERSSFWRSRPPQPWTVTKLRRGYFWFNSDTQERFCEGALGIEASALGH